MEWGPCKHCKKESDIARDFRSRYVCRECSNKKARNQDRKSRRQQKEWRKRKLSTAVKSGTRCMESGGEATFSSLWYAVEWCLLRQGVKTGNTFAVIENRRENGCNYCDLKECVALGYLPDNVKVDRQLIQGG